MKYLFLSLSFFIFSCTTNHNQSIKNLPNWYISPLQNDLSNLYGVGEGFTVEEAKASALKDLASKLMTSISSTTTIKSEEDNFSFNETTKRQIDEVIEKITFTNYEITNSDNIGNKIYIQISTDRDIFVNNQKNKLKGLNSKMADIYQKIDKKTILEKRNDLFKIKNLIKEAISINYILSGLGEIENQNKIKNIDQYQLYEQKYDHILDKIEFFISSKSNKKIANVIKLALNQEKIKIASNKNLNNQNLVTIDIGSSLTNNKIYGANITKLRINITLTSSNSKILASNLIEVSGSSSIDQNESFNAAIAELKNKIDQETILIILGIDKNDN